MVDAVQILREAGFYLQDGKTIASTAAHFGVTEQTIINHFKRLPGIDSEIAAAVKAKSLEAQNNGRIRGGQNGSRKVVYTTEYVDELAVAFLNSNLSLSKFAKSIGWPKSTLYDVLTSPSLSSNLAAEVRQRFADNKSAAPPLSKSIASDVLGIVDDRMPEVNKTGFITRR